MDRHDWDSLRNQFIPSSAALAMDGQGHLLNESRYKFFLDCYWRHFHPFFPIIHSSTLALGPPPPLLALMMVTIGAMLSSSPAPSVAFYKSCVGFFTTVSFPNSINPFLPSSLLSWPRKEKEKKRKEKERKEKKRIFFLKKPKKSYCTPQQHHEITTNSPLSDMQTVILLEAFSRYLSREARCENMATSSRFQTLYASVCSHFFLSSSAFSLLFFFLGAQIQSC